MAATLPASLKSTEITRFVHRAAQLENVKPVIWYWCSFHVANQILEHNLHTKDGEAMAFTTKLMDDLEQFKAQNTTNDAVTDDLVGKAYVEQFALETFSRADNTVRANKATRQTADTFQAAGTFLDLLGVFGPLEPEIAAKSKYAKYHGLRIAKAIRAGEDPNLSNPKQEPEPEDSLPPLDPNDAEVRAIESGLTKPRQPSVVDAVDETDRLQAQLARTSSLDQSLHPSRDPSEIRRQRQPSVAEVPDQTHIEQSKLAQQSLRDESLHPSRAPSIPRSGEEAVSPLAPHDAASFYTSSVPADVSPVESPPTSRKPSIGGNYFPVTPPTLPSVQPPIQHPSTTTANTHDIPGGPAFPQPPTTFTSPVQANINAPVSPPPPNNLTGHFMTTAPGHTPQIPPNFAPQSQPREQIPQAPPQINQHPPTFSAPSPSTQYYQGNFNQQGPTIQHSQPSQTASNTMPSTAPVPNVVLDEEAILKAQKHARWAISALNFEDVQTAIRELEGALKTLGAR